MKGDSKPGLITNLIDIVFWGLVVFCTFGAVVYILGLVIQIPRMCVIMTLICLCLGFLLSVGCFIFKLRKELK